MSIGEKGPFIKIKPFTELVEVTPLKGTRFDRLNERLVRVGWELAKLS